GLSGLAGPTVIAHLSHEEVPRHVPQDGAVVIVADAATAAEGARRTAERLGVAARVLDTAVTGEARRVGWRLAETAMGAGPGMSIFAGETTVAVTGGGSGGRNQELALAAAIALAGAPGALVASVGTDGIDGPTIAAGGVADGETVSRGSAAGMDAAEALAANDSGTYLDAVGGRLISGPTGTNVGDVMVAWGR
ncbi:MAG: hypothetical protein MUP76_03370, partial [Acidimicrobiia bacterium]|nr:hypothetical protein [Acidimicrobiia bacterium]